MSRARGRVVDSDRAMIDRTVRRLGLQAGALVAVVVVTVAVIVGLLIVREQRGSDEALLRHAAVSAEDASDPPAGMWLVLVDHGVRTSTPGLPRSLPYVPDLQAAQSRQEPTERRLRVDGVHVAVLTQSRPQGAVQAVLNLRGQDELQRHVVLALVFVGLAGLVAAAGSGWLLAHHAVRPLASALARQREFVADASHELRTPLTLLSTRAQLLHRQLAATGGDETAIRDASGVVVDAERLAEVVEDLLLAADPRGDDAAVPVDLGEVCAQVAASAEPYAQGRSVALRLELTPASVIANPTAMRRAVLALLDNAIGHTPSGGSVTVAAGTGRGVAHVTISDTGPGLEPADAERLFRRFAAGGQQASRRGYGLGLALVRDIAARHGGAIRVLDPQGGVGARFRLELPADSERSHDQPVQLRRAARSRRRR